MDGSKLKNKTVLVTGARGFIGLAVCKALKTRGAAVHGAGRSVDDTRPYGMSYRAVDLTDTDATDRLISEVKPAYIVHLAGCSVARRELEWVQKTFAANLLTTVNVLSAAQRAGVEKTVIAGSLEQPDEEIAESIPTSPYAASKWAATGYSRMFHTVYGMQVATARIFMVYGPGQKELQKMIPYVCLSTLAGTAPKLMSGARRVDWVYVDDVAEGLLRMLVNGPGDGSLVDIGTGRLVSTGKVAEMICEQSGSGVSPSTGAIPDRAMEQVRKADIEQTMRLIGWRPEITLEIGLERTLAWYKQTRAAS